MADFPPNLDDGELWLPSDILPDSKKVEENGVEMFPSELTYMEELAQQLSSYALLEQQQTQTKKITTTKKSPTPEVIPFGSFEPNRVNNGGFNKVGGNRNRGTGVVHSVYASDQGGFRVELTPGYHHVPPIRPVVITQGKGFVQSRGRVLQKQQNQGGGNYFLPYMANGGGFVKGTGVFLPRIETTVNGASKKQGVKNDENYYRVPVKRNSNKNSVGKKEGLGLKATTDMGLPPEWTY
ncbi:hypothetical protein ACHQM5_019889 [Ranunculus cassubicifolius]